MTAQRRESFDDLGDARRPYLGNLPSSHAQQAQVRPVRCSTSAEKPEEDRDRLAKIPSKINRHSLIVDDKR